MRRIVCFLLICCMLCSSALAYSNGDTIVYITRTGECYHRGSCRYLAKSKYEITLEEAVVRGYRACKVCEPPELAGVASAALSSDPKANAEAAAAYAAKAVSALSGGSTGKKRSADLTAALGSAVGYSLSYVCAIGAAVREQILSE